MVDAFVAMRDGRLALSLSAVMIAGIRLVPVRCIDILPAQLAIAGRREMLICPNAPKTVGT